MMKKILSEWLGYWRFRRELAQLQRSQFARDQFKQGYLVGYHKGRLHERVGALNLLEPDLDPPHPQVQIANIAVDVGMRDLLEALWKWGLWTQFSCQGDPDKFAPHEPYGREYATQIVFSTFDEAVTFTKKSASLLGFKNHSEGGLVLRTMAPMDGETARAEVTFSPLLLPEITALWVEFEKTPTVAAEQSSAPRRKQSGQMVDVGRLAADQKIRPE
ncbi:hypothetical protein [Microcella humidisoli]|uniref:Uncharacterized protein n=1 Tax=Microcella humidisoli TaxID=2963406 RepID=A0ABY5FTG8_9MICO|nr:hypothetical protein [Microcella humidisoli]UTT61528.1 hypothetical protein NNL39_07495 [Microcella humidisoli]